MNTDKIRLDWLNAEGRVVKMADGWHAWLRGFPEKSLIAPDVREAIDAAIRGTWRSARHHGEEEAIVP